MTYTEVITTLENEIKSGKAIVRDKNLENKKFKKLAKGNIFEEDILGLWFRSRTWKIYDR